MFFQVANAHLLLLNESGLNSHFISTFNIHEHLFKFVWKDRIVGDSWHNYLAKNEVLPPQHLILIKY